MIGQQHMQCIEKTCTVTKHSNWPNNACAHVQVATAFLVNISTWPEQLRDMGACTSVMASTSTSCPASVQTATVQWPQPSAENCCAACLIS